MPREIDYDQATKTAEKLLRIGTLSYRQISYASGIPLWSIREIQTEMNMERRRLMHVLRKTMMEIGEGIHGAAINEDALHDKFMAFVEISQALIYGRTITEEERDDLWNFICDIDGSDLDEFLSDFVCGPEDSEVKIMTRAYGVLHSVYAEMLIKHYDSENITPEDDRDYEEDEEEPADDAPGEDWEV